mgnify:FL=1
MPEYERPTSDFVTSTLSGALVAGEATATIGASLDLPATNGILQIDYDSVIAVGLDDGPETISYATYTSATGALAGMTRGLNGTTGVAHANGAKVQCGFSVSYFGGAMIKNDDLETTAGEPGGAWKSWTPTWTNLTVGAGGTVVAKYTQIGKTVHYYLSFTFGTGSSVGDVMFSLPITSTNAGDGAIFGMVRLVDANSAYFCGYVLVNSATTAEITYDNGTGGAAVLSSTAPFTWATNDRIVVTGTYEAA